MHVPPASSIFFLADDVKDAASTFKATFNDPLPRIFKGYFGFVKIPALVRVSKLTKVFFFKSEKAETLIMENLFWITLIIYFVLRIKETSKAIKQ